MRYNRKGMLGIQIQKIAIGFMSLAILGGSLFGIPSVVYAQSSSETTPAVVSNSLKDNGREAQDDLRFIAVGDMQKGGESQKTVADQMARLAKREAISFVLLLGDNIDRHGVKSTKDRRWQKRFEDVYDGEWLNVPFYPVLGNHDYKGDENAQVAYTKISSRWRMPKRYYSFREGVGGSTQVDFFALDTNTIIDGGDEKQIEWFEKSLAGSQARWKIVYAHHPIYSSGKYSGIKKVKDTLEPLLIQYNVDLYMSGHDHNLEMIEPSSGVYYLISGAGSKPRPFEPGENTLFGYYGLGFAWLTVSYEGIKIRFLDDLGETIYTFTIQKVTDTPQAEPVLGAKAFPGKG